MSVHMVQAKIKPDSVTGVRAATRKMFAAINEAQPNVQPLTVVGSYRMF
jgi:hypothetical protein